MKEKMNMGDEKMNAIIEEVNENMDARMETMDAKIDKQKDDIITSLTEKFQKETRMKQKKSKNNNQGRKYKFDDFVKKFWQKFNFCVKRTVMNLLPQLFAPTNFCQQV